MDSKLRSQVNQNAPPALLDYAMGFWFVHLAHISTSQPDFLMLLLKFFQEPHLLIWISVTARWNQLKDLLDAPQHLVVTGKKLLELYIEDVEVL